ncbi:MAG TPA: hypothetical protein VGQ99_10400 [Tepidisphaeraceae bacterium]|jgi:hypothetical protein|nr:hypothetical protein [Tepidisphaeraceae bacterium]
MIIDKRGRGGEEGENSEVRIQKKTPHLPSPRSTGKRGRGGRSGAGGKWAYQERGRGGSWEVVGRGRDGGADCVKKITKYVDIVKKFT